MSLDRGAGIPFGARDPRTCPTIRSSRLTKVEASQIFVCDNEGVRGADQSLALVSGVVLTLGPARPFAASDHQLPDSNGAGPLYPIYGSYRTYSCAPLGPAGAPGANCTLSVHAKAQGACYMTAHSGWRCAMADPAATQQREQPPPSRGE